MSERTPAARPKACARMDEVCSSDSPGGGHSSTAVAADVGVIIGAADAGVLGAGESAGVEIGGSRAVSGAAVGASAAAAGVAATCTAGCATCGGAGAVETICAVIADDDAVPAGSAAVSAFRLAGSATGDSVPAVDVAAISSPAADVAAGLASGAGAGAGAVADCGDRLALAPGVAFAAG